MKKYVRLLKLNELLVEKNYFLFGARSTGKTTLIEDTFLDALVFDLLDDEVYERLLRNPKLISESIINKNQIVIIDEIQRLPKLLNEVHRLTRKIPNRFLLTGSSARKLRRGASNLLGGRAWEAHLYPLSYLEIDDFDLIRYLNVGGLPHIYLSDYPDKELKHYINLYLKEEVVAEALTRKLEYFVSFLDTLALSNGEELHFQNLSNDSQVPARTIQNYVQILEDTLIGFQLHAYKKSKKRKAITRSKFYFFDLGVTNYLAKRGEIKPDSELYGKAFEHFIIREIKTQIEYSGKDLAIFYWRSTSQFEVDLIIGDLIAIEIKATSSVCKRHLRGLKALREEQQIKEYFVISNDSFERVIDGVSIVHWRNFLRSLIEKISI